MIGFVQILGGLALFMYGIRLLSAGMEKLAGDQIQKWLDRVTNSRLKSGVFGAFSTAVIQSSGLLMVTMIGLVNANIMTVEQSVSVMLGQEIGTTITAQIVAFDIGYLRLILVIMGLIFLEFFPKKDWKKYGEILMGLGIVFVGMSYMATALDNLIEISWVSNLLKEMGYHPLVGVLVGLVMTSITQSSTAVTSMVVAMGITHVVALEGAVGMILGANIGSCITGFIASLPLSRTARQTSMAQITINVIGVLVFIPFITPYSSFIKMTSPDLPRQIANAHSIFNIAVSAFLFPFVHQIAQFAAWLIPARKEDEKTKVTAYIDDMQYRVPAVALNEAARELNRLGEITAEMVENSCTALVEQKVELIPSVLDQEEKVVDPISKELGIFVDNLLREDLSQAQQKRAFQIKSLLVDIERVGDLAEDIAQYAEERQDHQVPFSSHAIGELDSVWKQAHHIYLLSLQSFIDGDKELADKVCVLESEFDQLYWKTRQAHIDRLESGLCHPEADVIYTETLRALERISDHADNLGVSVSRTLT